MRQISLECIGVSCLQFVRRTTSRLLFTAFLVCLFLPIASVFTSPAPAPIISDEPEQEYQVLVVAHISKDFSDLETTFVRQAFIEWERATNGYVKFYPVLEINPIELSLPMNRFYTLKVIRIEPVGEDHSIVRAFDAMHYPIAAYSDVNNFMNQRISTMIVVRSRIDSYSAYTGIIEHECAHFFGLEHTSDENTLMYPGLGSAYCITSKDLRQFCDLYGCNSETMFPCMLNNNSCVDSTYHIWNPLGDP
jgi:hypothetical protein